jgi:hypothetical protein
MAHHRTCGLDNAARASRVNSRQPIQYRL